MLSMLIHFPICPSLTEPQGSALVRTVKGISARDLLVLGSQCIRLWCVCVQAREMLLQLVDGKCAASSSDAFGRDGTVLPPALVLSNIPPLMWKELQLRVRAVVPVELHDEDKSSDLKNIIIAQEAKQGWAKKWPVKSQHCYLANIPATLVRHL